MREAPQVVGRRALLPRAPDRLPLEQVVGARVGAGLGHAAVRLHDPRPGADEEQRRDRAAVGELGEQQPCVPRRPEGVPHVAVRGLGPDQEPGPVRRLAVDRVELVEALGARVDDAHAAGLRLVHVLAPLLAQVAPQGGLVGREVDDARRDRLDRRRRRASRPPRAPPVTAPPSSGPAPRSISGSIRRWLTRPAVEAPAARPDRGERP